MKRITIACLSYDRQDAVSRLQSLGTVHAVPYMQPSSEALDELRRRAAQLSRLMNALKLQGLPLGGQEDAQGAEEALAEGLQVLDGLKQCEEDLSEACKSIAQLQPWGSFSREKIGEIQAHGLYVYLCASARSKVPELKDGAVMQVISESRGQLYYALVSPVALDEMLLPLAALPVESSIRTWMERETQVQERQRSLQGRLAEIAASKGGALERFAQVLNERVDFAVARDGMAESGSISFLRGYVPADRIDALRMEARNNGWAIRYEEVPQDDGDVPTNLKIAKPFAMAKGIFDFVGILPGYWETDVSGCMLIFLSLFCGMLVGDAGYGLLFTLLVLWFRRKAKSENARQGLNLLLVMSASILIYGALCCSWFAIPKEKLPSFLKFCPWLCNEKADDHVKLLCFFIGAFQMSLARVWRAVQAARSVDLQKDEMRTFIGKVREALGHLGWGAFLWANFGMTKLLIVDGGSVGELSAPFCWLYGIGFVMILAFSVNWTDMGTVIYMPFTFINCFVDVLSYIRLFAVGLSSFYIGQSFNDMAMSINGDLSSLVWLKLPASILILALGHLLNVALACMGVLVHGIRLNTLEFSGHMDLSWSGKAYKPLRLSK